MLLKHQQLKWRIKTKGLKGKNYTCVIHKVNPDGSFNRNRISSPLINESRLEVVSPTTARSDVMRSLFTLSSKDSNAKFIGAFFIVFLKVTFFFLVSVLGIKGNY